MKIELSADSGAYPGSDLLAGEKSLPLELVIRCDPGDEVLHLTALADCLEKLSRDLKYFVGLRTVNILKATPSGRRAEELANRRYSQGKILGKLKAMDSGPVSYMDAVLRAPVGDLDEFLKSKGYDLKISLTEPLKVSEALDPL